MSAQWGGDSARECRQAAGAGINAAPEETGSVENRLLLSRRLVSALVRIIGDLPGGSLANFEFVRVSASHAAVNREHHEIVAAPANVVALNSPAAVTNAVATRISLSDIIRRKAGVRSDGELQCCVRNTPTGCFAKSFMRVRISCFTPPLPKGEREFAFFVCLLSSIELAGNHYVRLDT